MFLRLNVHKEQLRSVVVVGLGVVASIASVVATVGFATPGIANSGSYSTTPLYLRSRFYDLRGSRNLECIESLAERKIINGFPDGSFRPQFPVTRAQFAAMVSQAFPSVSPNLSPRQFVDVPRYGWAAGGIQTAYQTGFMSGYPGYRFEPDWGITRAQVLVSLASGLNYSPSGSTVRTLNAAFRDAHQIPPYARNAIAAASQRQLVAYDPKARLLRPNQLATRGEVATFLCQALQGAQQATNQTAEPVN